MTVEDRHSDSFGGPELQAERQKRPDPVHELHRVERERLESLLKTRFDEIASLTALLRKQEVDLGSLRELVQTQAAALKQQADMENQIKQLGNELLKLHDLNLAGHEKRDRIEIKCADLENRIRSKDQLNARVIMEYGRAIGKLLETSDWPLLTEQGRLKRRMKLLLRSGLFDAGWYLARYPDVAGSGMDPLLHYLRFGIHEGRLPNPALDDYP